MTVAVLVLVRVLAAAAAVFLGYRAVPYSLAGVRERSGGAFLLSLGLLAVVGVCVYVAIDPTLALDAAKDMLRFGPDPVYPRGGGRDLMP